MKAENLVTHLVFLREDHLEFEMAYQTEESLVLKKVLMKEKKRDPNLESWIEMAFPSLHQ